MWLKYLAILKWQWKFGRSPLPAQPPPPRVQLAPPAQAEEAPNSRKCFLPALVQTPIHNIVRNCSAAYCTDLEMTGRRKKHLSTAQSRRAAHLFCHIHHVHLFTSCFFFIFLFSVSHVSNINQTNSNWIQTIKPNLTKPNQTKCLGCASSPLLCLAAAP